MGQQIQTDPEDKSLNLGKFFRSYASGSFNSKQGISGFYVRF